MRRENMEIKKKNRLAVREEALNWQLLLIHPISEFNP
jgi:hypothetical protein